jgi:GDP-L-fucose synthase
MSFIANKKVLVAGGAGLIGSRLIERLLSEGAQIRATIHRKDPNVVDDLIEYVRCDLRNRDECVKVTEGIQYVFMCAANSSGAAAMTSDPMQHVTPNLLINTQLLEAAYFAKVEKTVFLSSTTGYPPSGERKVKEDEMFNDEPYSKYYFTGWLKRFSEILCRMYGEKMAKPMTTIVLRPTNVYGINDDFNFETSHVLPALIRKVVERWDPIEVWGDGNDIRDFIFVDDMIEAMIVAVEKLNGFSTLNIGLGKGHSVKELLAMILEIDGYSDAKVVYNSDKPTMIPIRIVDVTKANMDLGFEAKTSLREGLKKTITWYRESLKKSS